MSGCAQAASQISRSLGQTRLPDVRVCVYNNRGHKRRDISRDKAVRVICWLNHSSLSLSPSTIFVALERIFLPKLIYSVTTFVSSCRFDTHYRVDDTLGDYIYIYI